MTVELRRIGTTDLSVFPLCLGGNVFGWTADERQSFEVLDAYVAAGGNFIDTAAQYSNWVPGNKGGESETVIGRWLSGRSDRDDLVIATKVGHMGLGNPGGLKRQRVLEQTDECLQRLGVDHIDLLYAHHDDPGTELEETLAAFDQVVKEGKARYVAASNYTAPRLAAALRVADRTGTPRFVALQCYYNILAREQFEGELSGVADEEELGCVAYWALAKGYLTGKYHHRAPNQDGGLSDRAERHSVRDYGTPQAEAILRCLFEIAAEKGTNPAAVALAWTAARAPIVAPIASARSTAQLSDLLEMTEVQLGPDEIEKLDAVSQPTEALG